MIYWETHLDLKNKLHYTFPISEKKQKRYNSIHQTKRRKDKEFKMV